MSWYKTSYNPIVATNPIQIIKATKIPFIMFLVPINSNIIANKNSMMNEIIAHRFDVRSATPSIETLSHVFIPYKYIDHTHADSILALSNQSNGKRARFYRPL